MYAQNGAATVLSSCPPIVCYRQRGKETSVTPVSFSFCVYDGIKRTGIILYSFSRTQNEQKISVYDGKQLRCLCFSFFAQSKKASKKSNDFLERGKTYAI